MKFTQFLTVFVVTFSVFASVIPEEDQTNIEVIGKCYEALLPYNECIPYIEDDNEIYKKRCIEFEN